MSSFGGSSLNQQPASPNYLQQQLQGAQNSISFFQSNPNLINSSVLHTTLTTNQQNVNNSNSHNHAQSNGVAQNGTIVHATHMFLPVSESLIYNLTSSNLLLLLQESKCI